MYPLKIVLIAALVLWSLVLTGCPAKTLDKAQSSSAKIATYANTGVNVTRDLYQNGVININQKDAIARGWIALAQAGQTFDLAVAKMRAQYGSTVPPKSEIEALFVTFDSEVVAKFIDVLKSIGVGTLPAEFQTVIAAIRTAVLLVAGMIGNKAQTAAKLAAAGA